MKNTVRRLDVVALFLPEIRELLAKKDFTALKQLLKNIHSIDLAEGWAYLDAQAKIIIFKLLGSKKAVEVFESLRFDEQTYILNNLESTEVAQIINEMAPDERAKLFKDLPPKAFKKLLNVVSKEKVQNIKALLVYPGAAAGSLMTTEFVELKKEMSARQAMLSTQENLRAGYRENVYSIFVTDENHKLIGAISLQDLLKAPPDMLIKDIMVSTDLIKIDVETNIKDVTACFKKYDLLDAPVVDKEGVLLGIITVDDIVAEMEREATKDIYEIGKMDARGGEIISYARVTTQELVRRRAGWLILLLIFDFFSGTVLKSFEHSLNTVVALAFFIPMLLDTGGNAGAQTSITIIRGLATGDVNIKNVFKIIRLELGTAIFISLIIGCVAFGRAFLLQKDFSLAVVVGLSMTLIGALGIATGIALPLLSKKVGLDPAVLAGPIITSVVDVAGLIIYFKVAQAFIPALRF